MGKIEWRVVGGEWRDSTATSPPAPSASLTTHHGPLTTPMSDHPDHLDDIFAALQAVAGLFRTGVRQGEAHALEGTEDVRERIRQFEDRLKAAIDQTAREVLVDLESRRLAFEEALKEAVQSTVADVWTELTEDVQSACRRAGVFG